MTARNTTSPLYVRVHSVYQETDTVKSYELGALDGNDLPEFRAGAHIGIVMPGRITRYYSICSSPHERKFYTIGVQREDAGRGGSAMVHAKLKQGKILKLHRPRNLFPLEPRGHHILIAGGIGITPMLSMAAELDSKQQTFELLCCVRDITRLPFSKAVQTLAQQGRAHILLSSNGAPNLAPWLEQPRPEVNVYVCGSSRFMQAVDDMSAHWPAEQIHRESFTPVLGRDGDVPFTVFAKRSNVTLRVDADQSILHALRANGIELDSVCENGTCGTCKVAYCQGDPDHRDMVLSAQDRKKSLISCVTRAKGPLTLDI